MKEVIIISVIVIVIFLGNYWIENFLESTENELIDKLDNLQIQIEKGVMNDFASVEEIDTMWTNLKWKWNLLTNHQKIDEMEVEWKRFMKNYERKEDSESLVNIISFRTMVNDLHKGETLDITNIL